MNLSSDDTFNLIYSLILLVFIGSSAIMHFRGQPVKFLKDASIWLGVIFVLIILYSYRYEFEGIKNRFVGELNPSYAITGEGGELKFRIARDGHYHVKARINRQPIEFLVDTGASDVVITRKIAGQIGININDLRFTRVYNTANGKVYGAPVVIDVLQIGDYKFYDVRASVNDADMDKPLLGMSFLDKLDGYEVRDGVLTLWP